MKKQKPNVAVVGCGYWGKNLIRNFHNLGCLRAVCDVDAGRLQEIADTYAVPAVSDYDELLKRDDIQGIVIAAPAAQHYELASKALLAGKDVFVEKPIALHAAEGQELVDLADKHKRILMVGHLLLYHPAIRELKRLLASGEFGKLQYIYSSRLNWGKFRSEENILWSFAPHDISAILYLLNEDPTVVGAHGTSYVTPRVADVTLSTLEFASGVEAHIFVSWLHPFKEQKLVIVGSRKMAVFDDTEKERKLLVYPHQIDWVDRMPVAHKGDGQNVPISTDEPLLLECQHFLDRIEDRGKPLTDGENAVRVLRILEACDKSLQTSGKPVPMTTQTPKYHVHPLAVVDQPSDIGDGTRVWHFAHVMNGTRIGKNCILGQNVHVASGVKIGNNVKIQNNVSVYAGVELEDDVFCGPSMVFTNVINPRSHVDRKTEYQRTLVRKGSSLGANSTVVCGTTIGEYAFVAAGAVVTSDVPDYGLVMGVPARRVGWMCQCGARLEVQDDQATCLSCEKSYRQEGDRLTLRHTPAEPALATVEPVLHEAVA